MQVDNPVMQSNAKNPLTSPAQRLKAIYESKRRELHLSQDKVAAECGWQSQSTVSQYLNGLIPLNFEAAVKFATLLRIAVSEFHTEFGAVLEAYQASSLQLPQDAIEFARVYVQLDPRRRDAARNFIEYQLFVQSAGDLKNDSEPPPPDRPIASVKRMRDQ